ncbi:MAG TPA: pyrimidine reductase family protein [Jatrophihabitans sp.]|nr:pyrimidine reductase family protein [Jatrophihabitans sp.]
MRALLPEPCADADVHAHYAADWIEPGGFRVNFVAAVDGAVSAGGRSRGLQTPGDNSVFAALRDLADVVAVGAGTAVAEGYRAVRVGEQRRAVRREHGLPAPLPIAVLSRTLRLDPAQGLFADAAPDARTLVLTCGAADADRRRALQQVADVIECGDDTVDPLLARQALEDRGFRRILCEGGPTVFADLADAGVVDELCLSVTPLLAGPGAGRITAGRPWDATVPLSLVGLLEEDGALFCRYRAGRRSVASAR